MVSIIGIRVSIMTAITIITTIAYAVSLAAAVTLEMHLIDALGKTTGKALGF